jgi:hypothetical protein
VRTWWPVAAAVVALLRPAAASAQRACVEGAGVYGGAFDANLVDTLAANFVTCVHLRLRQDVWSGPDDPMPRGMPPSTMFEAWDRLIDYYRGRNIDVYLEVGADAVGRQVHELRDPAVRARYAAFFVRVFQRYRRQVRRFELPDGGDRPPPVGVAGHNALAPEDVAALALTVREAVERDRGTSPCNRHELALGGVRSDGATAAGVNYLRAVYAAGLGEEGAGGLWTPYYERSGRPPFDAIAMHSLSGFGPLLDAASQGEGAALGPADVVGDVLARFEGSRTARPVWITAGGLPSDGSEAQNVRQRTWLTAFFNTAVRADLSTPVAMASWYAFIEPPWDRGGWGFYDDGVLQRSNERSAGLGAFAGAMGANRPHPNALLRWNDGPLRLAPGEVRRVHLRMTNYGPFAGRSTWHAGDIRVGAAAGCPDAEDDNQVLWTGFPTGGIGAPWPLYGRVNVPFPLGRDILAGGSVAVEWDITAPPEPGRYALSARLIWGENQWFGQNATTTVVVVAPMDAAADVAGDVGVDASEVWDAPAAEESVSDASFDAVGAAGDAAVLDVADEPDAPMDDGTIDASEVPAGADAAPGRPTREGCGCGVGGNNRASWWGLGMGVALLLRRRRA